MTKKKAPIRWRRKRRSAWAGGFRYELYQGTTRLAIVDETRDSDRKGWYWYGYGRNSLTLGVYEDHKGVWETPAEAKTACRAWLRGNHAELWKEHEARS